MRILSAGKFFLGTLALCFAMAGCGECEHKWSNWKTVTPASCETKGVAQRKCSECGKEETKETDALGHNFVAGICTVCGKRESDVPKDDNHFFHIDANDLVLFFEQDTVISEE